MSTGTSLLNCLAFWQSTYFNLEALEVLTNCVADSRVLRTILVALDTTFPEIVAF